MEVSEHRAAKCSDQGIKIIFKFQFSNASGNLFITKVVIGYRLFN